MRLTEPKNDNINILDYLGLSPRKRYLFGKNTVSFNVSIEKRNKSITNMIIAVLLAIVIGVIFLNLPDNVRTAADADVLSPLFTKLIAIMSAIATPMIFFAVVLGIIGLEYVTVIGKIGKKLLEKMMLTYIFVSCFAVGVSILAFSFIEGGGSQTNGLKDLTKLILDIVPSNLFEPFTTDNHLQVITLAVFTGVILVLLGDASAKIKSAIEQVSALVNKMMSTVCKLLPLIVFLGVLEIIIEKKWAQMSTIWITIVSFFAICGVVLAFVSLRTVHATKVPIRTLIKKQRASLLINLTTSSQVAAFPDSVDCCKHRYGISSKLVDFALPIEMVAYMPCGAVMLSLIGFTLASIYGTQISLLWIIKCIILVIIIAISAPPVPGSGFVVISILMSGLGISAEGLPIAIMIITLCGYFLPLFNGYLMQLELLMVAHKENQVDLDVLKKDCT